MGRRRIYSRTIVGGVVGGVDWGALLASQTAKELADGAPRRNQNLPDATNNKRKWRQLKAFSEQGIETARRSLEDKIIE